MSIDPGADPASHPAAEELERVTRNAHIFVRRGELEAAEKAIRRGLEISPENSELHELLGDALAAREDNERAAEAYKRAAALDSSNDSAETKYARLVLRMKGAAAGLTPDPLVSAPIAGKRKPSVAFAASLLWPGLGQWYNGEMSKAGLLAAAGALVFVLLLVTGQFDSLINVIGNTAVPASVSGGRPGGGSAASILWLLFLAVWGYAAVDAAAGVSRLTKSADASYTEPDF